VAVAEVPMRTESAESLVSGKRIDSGLVDEAARAVSADIKPLTDARSTEFYRKHVSQILFKDTFAKAWNRAVREK
jgi:CO/xanthine dehydrogenase FAD-binding subunit